MVFSTYLFLFWFLPISIGVYALLPTRFRNLWLAVISYVFYGWFKPQYCLLLAGATIANYFCGQRIDAATTDRARRMWLAASVVGNLGTLAFFKYAGMLTEWLDAAVRLISGGSAGTLIPILQVALPIGISFYLFQAISYTVDVYRKDARPAKSLIDFAAYIAMFPQLVAGPIVRYQTIADDLASRTHSTAKTILGIRFFMLGLAKKVLVADAFGMLVPLAFDAEPPGFASAWVGVLAYTLQIYFDFSAYSDMAVGLGLFLGFNLPQNFDSPYKSQSITEFWRRWHMSLSTWLRDYLYLPLGGNRRGVWRTYRNLMLVMLLGGLWHGASIMFLAWGAWHGTLLALERMLGTSHPLQRLPAPLAILATNLLVIAAWVPFRSNSPDQMLSVLGAMISPDTTWSLDPLPSHSWPLVWCIPLFFALCWFAPNSWSMLRSLRSSSLALESLLGAMALWVVLAQRESPFLYFQF